MKRRAHGMRQFNERPRPGDVNLAGLVENAGDDAFRAGGFGGEDLGLHLMEFVRGVDKSAAAGPDEHTDGNADGLDDFLNEVDSRRKAADGEMAANLDAVRAASFAGPSAMRRLCA